MGLCRSDFDVADKLNSSSRRSSRAGSNSTRKVYTTYAFTIDVDATTTLVLGVATRHARNDWLHTLRVATSSMTSRKSIDMHWSFRGTSLSDDATAYDDSATISTVSSLPWLLERMAQDPLFTLSSYQRSLLWQHRQTLPKTFSVLPRLLTCREWILPAYHDDLAMLLESTMPPAHPTEYIILLGRPLAHLSMVREFAIEKLDVALDNAALATVLPQLVQCMKWEPYAASRLVTWVFRRAIDAAVVLGAPLFWALHVETFVPQYTQRFQLLEQAYLMAAGRSMRRMLVNQLELCRELHRLARDMQTAVVTSTSSGVSSLDSLLRSRLCALNVSYAGRVSLPLLSNCTLVEFSTSECRVLKSTKRPLWLTLETAARTKVSVIFKAGDDVRQDMVTLQLFGLMQQLWDDANIPTQLQLYGCIATSPTSGMVEVVGDAVTTAAIHKEGGFLGPMQDMRFAKWIESHNTSPKQHMQALDLFRRSAAGYCVATHVLGIGDRHNDNIMVCRASNHCRGV
ncbi:hypothetical protein DYB32_009724 [Aphanomyces invadans]|uniref:PI3K/PI4K catalytic domain-containing protein n=1 Tax=Aphanomyces invadans TaxID=157072 RepID=A0A3R6ZI55_9STRA|nr:hypothetical protein DYB32_009724 [Aphanomyces invadans]